MRLMDIEMDFIIDDNDKLWFINTDSDGLYYIEKTNYCIHYVDALPDKSEYRLYSSGIIYNQQLFFFPFYSNHILVYHICDGTFEKIEYEEFRSEKNQYSISFVEKDTAIAISTYGQRKILLVDLKKKIVKEKLLKELEIGTLSRDFVVKNQRLFLTMIDNPSIFEINLQTLEIKIYQCNLNISGFGTIAAQGNNTFILSGVDGIYEWDIKNNEINKYNEFPINFGYQMQQDGIKIHREFDESRLKYKQPFWRSILVKQELYLISAVANMSLVYNLQTHLISELDLSEMETEESLKKAPLSSRSSVLKHVMVSSSNNIIICSSGKNCSIILIDTEKKDTTEVKGRINESDVYRLLQTKEMVKENLIFDLNTWLNFLIES